MFKIEIENGWSEVPQTTGVWSKLLSGDFDEETSSGHRTRLIRFDAGGKTYAPYTHAYWEEVYLLDGELTTSQDGVTRDASSYVIRPPGTEHGPFVSNTGCYMLEIQYFANRKTGLRDYVDLKAPHERLRPDR